MNNLSTGDHGNYSRHAAIISYLNPAVNEEFQRRGQTCVNLLLFRANVIYLT